MLLSLIIQNLLWSQGLVILGCIVATGVVSYFIYRPLFYCTLLFLCFTIWFFRNPVRHCPELAYDKTIILAPADGKVVDIQFADFGNGFAQKISITLSLLDAHVTWVPVDGVIQKIEYHEGAFTFSYLPKCSLRNEHNDLYIKMSNNMTVMVRQIAGVIARRICWWRTSGQKIKAGDTFGMIRFGSCVELFLPAEVAIMVGTGQHVLGGQTVIAKWEAV